MGFTKWFTCAFFSVIFLNIVTSCTFDYGETDAEESKLPNMTMEGLEYVRVKNGQPVARMEADIGDRFESRHVMELKNFNFQQYNTSTGEIDAIGSGDKALVEMDTGNVQMNGSIHINVESENMTIDTESFTWKDKPKTLSGDDNLPVNIEKTDGTIINGKGFSSDLRSKTFIFSRDVDGVYVSEDDEDDKKEESSSKDAAAKTDQSADKNGGMSDESTTQDSTTQDSGTPE
ncbi:MAG: hypothetical protein Ta2F_04640 [Termitinemataceae bacterium]|nr:MAG: hypothetical protein Ta2F_04640 [Termitinemataceae bacterium]